MKCNYKAQIAIILQFLDVKKPLIIIYLYIKKSFYSNFKFSVKYQMVVLGFVFMGRSQNVEQIFMPEDADWHVVLKCTHCHQNFPKQVTFNKNQTVQMIKQHGIAHLGASCKNCDRKCFVTIDQNSTYCAKPNEDGLIKQTIAKVQCRGCEIVKVDIGNSLTVKVANSPTKYENADFTDLWCQMDEQTNLLIQVEDPKIEIVHINDKK